MSIQVSAQLEIRIHVRIQMCTVHRLKLPKDKQEKLVAFWVFAYALYEELLLH